ncbi:MAG: S-layer homology domain-containing protein [Syntrophomonadaceae bacterium]
MTREQRAVAILKAMYGAAYAPPACQGLFKDVPCSSPFAPWVEQFAREGITAGCSGGQYFCPAEPTTRGQTAVFLTKAFVLP